MNLRNKKIAVFHHCLDNIGGAEIVALSLARELDADLYTTNIDFENINKMGFSDISNRIFSIGKIPIASPFKQQFSFLRFRNLNLGKKYDFYVIAGDWAMSGAVHNQPNLWYIHSPLNELWQWKSIIKEEYLSWWQKPVFDIWVWFNQKLTLKYSKYVDNWVCNSLNTKNRINKYYKKEAQIIYPPIDTSSYYFNKIGDYWLAVNRLAKNKRVYLQMNSFSKLPQERLIIVGSYEKNVDHFEANRKYLESIKPDNVSVINWASQEELKELYANCKGFLITARDEDFGMTPLEAMASGKMVIAPNEGGFKETVINGENGILIDDIDEDKIVEVIKNIGNDLGKYKENCQRQAKNFDISIFVEKIKNIIYK